MRLDGTRRALRRRVRTDRPWIELTLFLLLIALKPAAAVEVDADAAGGADFLYLTTDGKQALLDERLTLGAGYALITDLHAARHGARMLGELEVDPITVAAVASWAPAQAGRGWSSLSLEVGHRWEGERVVVESSGELGLRRADVGTRLRTLTVGQMQGHLAARIVIDRRYELAADGLLSGYDTDLAARWLRGADAGLLVSVAGRPERWAAELRLGWWPHPRWRVDAGGGRIGFADGSGDAWLPRLGVRTGPWGWFTVEAAVELALAQGARPRPIGTLSVEVSP
jgi:hypothetical protein